jgi:hypothetical protein
MDSLTLVLALLGYPLSILANVTLDQLKNIKDKISDLTPMKELYIRCFYKAAEEHDKHYDNYSSKALKKVIKAIKKDKSKFLRLISQNKEFSITSFNRKEFQNDLSKKIIDAYRLKYDNYSVLMSQIIADCFNYYVPAFYNLMNEKEGIQAILVECLKLNQILDLLNVINQQMVTKDEFDDLRKIIYTYYVNHNGKYRKTLTDYDSYIRNKFKYLELRGFSPKVSGKEVRMELEDIFVPLAINKQQKIVPNIQDESVNNKNGNFDSIEILNHRSLVILGDPGSGKSTLLKYLATRVSGLRNREHLLKNIIPVFLKLSDYSDFYNKNRKSIYEYITNHLDNQFQHIYKENFDYSNMLILMDGLDEIADTPLRLKVTEQVMDLIARYPFNRYIVTSRIVGYQESKLGGAFEHYKLLPFRKEEIKLFSDQWYKSIAPNTDKNYEQAKQQSESLYKSIFRNSSVFKLATNPLLMTIISMIHYIGKKLPNKRIELYEISTETFLEHWVQLRITDEKQLKDKAEIIEILAPIAFEIHKEKSNALIEENEFKDEFLKYFQLIHTNTTWQEAKQTCNEFILFLRKQTGFFYEKGVDDEDNRFYGFMHLTFEEYLTAIEFVSKWSEKEIDLADYIFQPRWTEIIRLAASQIRLSFKGKAGRTQTSNFIQDILNAKDEFKEAYRPLQIACLIISDDVSITDELQNKIFDDIIKVLSTTESHSLVNSFSKLFSELFQSDQQNYFIDGFKKHLMTENKILLNNIIIILIDNYRFSFVFNLLKENLENIIVRDRLLKTYIGNPIRQESFFEEFQKDFILQYNFDWEDDENKKLLRYSITSLLQLDIPITNINYTFKPFFDFLKKIKNDDLFTFSINIYIRNLLRYRIRPRTYLIDVFLIFVRKTRELFPNKYFGNLLNSIQKIDSYFLHNEWYNYTYSYDYDYNLSNLFGSLMKVHNTIINFQWNYDFSVINFEEIEVKNIEKYKIAIKDNYSEKDFNDLLGHLYSLIGPLEENENISIFLKHFNYDFLFNFFGWRDFPFLEISKEPQRLSEILIKNSRSYLMQKGFKKEIDFASLDKMEIPYPVKLMFYIKASRPYDENLIKESLDYYNSCEDDMKEGVFEIIYDVLSIIR